MSRMYQFPGRAGCAAEFKIVTVREAAIVAGIRDRPEHLVDYWGSAVQSAPWFDSMKECCVAVFLNTRRAIVGHVLISIGTLDTTMVSPREVFRPAIVAAAAALVLMHNHPSGDPEPSCGDIKATRALIASGKVLGVNILDHIIIGNVMRGVFCSMRDSTRLNF